MEVVVTTGAVRCAGLQSDHHTNKPTSSFLQGGWHSCYPANSLKTLNGKKYNIPWTGLAYPKLTWGSFSLISFPVKGSWLSFSFFNVLHWCVIVVIINAYYIFLLLSWREGCQASPWPFYASTPNVYLWRTLILIQSVWLLSSTFLVPMSTVLNHNIFSAGWSSRWREIGLLKPTWR